MTLLLDDHKTFTHVEELNEAIRLHLRQHRYNLTPTAIKVLHTVSKYAVKYPGAAWLKAATLARLLSVSVKTVRRCLARLQELKIIEKRSTLRSVSGGFGANIIVVLAPEDTTDHSQVSTRSIASTFTAAKGGASIIKKETIPSKSTKDLVTNTYTGAYKAFLTTVEALEGAGDRKALNKLYGVYLAHTARLKSAYSADVLVNVGLQALRITYQTAKYKKLRNLAGYYNGTLDRLLDRLYYQEVADYYT